MRRAPALRRALALALAAALAACAAPAPDGSGARETGELFLWEAESPRAEGGTAFILGSLHMGTPELEYDPRILEAYEGSRAVVMEVDPEALEPARLASALRERARLPEGRTLPQVLEPELYYRLAERLSAAGRSPARFHRYEPWVAVLALSGAALNEEGLSTAHGAEEHFRSLAEGEKEVIGLETVEEQMALFDELPREVQIELLRESLDAAGDASSAKALLAAWRKGDAARLAELALPSGEDDASRILRRRVYLERNRRMAEGLAALLDDGGEWFVVVGAAHVVGPQGLPELLADRGYFVRRVSKSR